VFSADVTALRATAYGAGISFPPAATFRKPLEDFVPGSAAGFRSARRVGAG